jgi:uncharacterized protein (TIGR02246 family)
LATSAAAGPAASPPAVVHAEGVAPHAGVDAVYERFAAAYDALDGAAVADLYTADALYLVPGNEVMRGRDAIRGNLAGFLDAVRREGGRLAIRFEILDRVVAPGLVSDVGHFRLARSGGGGSEMRGKFAVVARQEGDGAWRFHVDSYSGVAEEAPLAAGTSSEEPLSPEEREGGRVPLPPAGAERNR